MLRDGQIKTNFYNYRFIRMNLYLSIPMYTAYRQLAKPTGPPVPNIPIYHFFAAGTKKICSCIFFQSAFPGNAFELTNFK